MVLVTREVCDGLFRGYSLWLRNYLLGHGVLSQDVDDVVQETFLKFFRYYGGKLVDEKLPGLLKRIADNYVIDLWRKARNRQTMSLETEDGIGLDRLVIAEASSFDARRRVHSVIATMKEPYKSALWYRYIQGFSIHDIAAMHDETEGTIKTRLMRAREMFSQTYVFYYGQRGSM